MVVPQDNVSTPTPVPMAFLLCNQVIVEEGNRRKTIVGVYNNMFLPSFPGNAGPVCLYARFMECEGEYNIRIEQVQVATQNVISTLEATLTSLDRNIAADFISPQLSIVLPSPGEYEFRLWMNGRYIHRVRFMASLRDAAET